MQYEHITNDADLARFCEAISSAPRIGFDTEFVSEDSYRPDLCLIQVVAGEHLAVIDPIAGLDPTPFWELLASPGHETIAHAAREELRFCIHAIDRRPNQLFDIQLAAAFVGLEYPAAYSTLAHKLLNKSLRKGETRTNWRRRPLSERQIDYALQDVAHLEQIRDALAERLDKLQRRSWFQDEMDTWQTEVENSDINARWRRVSGINGLSRRSLAIVRELWLWREQQAAEQNKPVRRVLRDDLIVELARRQTADQRRIRALRGMERRDLSKHHRQLAQSIERALALSDDECPTITIRPSVPQLNVLGQFLTTALGCICRSAQIAPNLVGTASDVRELVAHRLELTNGSEEVPRLASGWRAEIVGRKIEEFLSGKLSIRIKDPLADNPLIFESQEPQP